MSILLFRYLTRQSYRLQVCQFSTKQSIYPKDWSVASCRAIGRSATIVQINKLLDEIKSSLHTIYHEMQRRDNYVTAEKVKNEFLGHGQTSETLLDMFAKHNEDVKALVGITKAQPPTKSTKLPESTLLTSFSTNTVSPIFR